MLNGNGGSAIVPQPQPSVLDIQGVQSEGQVEGVVEEPTELVHPVWLDSRLLGCLFIHPGMSGIQRCTSRAWMKRYANGS